MSVRTLTANEARLLLRDPGNAFFALAFPAVLLVLVGLLLPGMREPIQVPGLTHLRTIDVYVPVVLCTAVATVAVSTFPTVFGTYRERGVLRRLAATPLPASRLLVAELAVSLGALVVAVGLALGLAGVVLGIAAPAQPAVAVLAFALTVAHMGALGCVLAAVVRSAANANAFGMMLYFPLLFVAGVWLPGPLMPATLREVASFLPLGAGAQALQEAWFGSGLPARQLVVMVVWTAVLGPLAARLFRWT
ncbi:ABC transporter permease [Cellulomonas carbonis]|uniref:Transport permease protein n=1 Tax=Cellulomonas carbonis T26 TaxID=947969 RepID=A0A0A0BVV3_9CELL|nr:ABC transporter permease [Cellulomonas carbonis]KGM12071.1 ABC transporter [Cellulomonas carbonis T26]GGC08232.1 transport permease protein [Cellulomonas carbonis]